MAKREGVWALTKDGNPTMCYASEENRGKGRCNHIGHADKGESAQDFFTRIYNEEQKEKEEKKRRKKEKTRRESRFDKNGNKTQAAIIYDEQEEKRKENIEKFEEELSSINREGIDKVIQYCKEHDMYTAPSSTRFHLASKGGLLQHSLNVYEASKKMMVDNGDGTYSYKVGDNEVCTTTEESLKIATLLHDFCKMDTYKPTEKWVKQPDNSWAKERSYKFNEELPMGHGEGSVWKVERMMHLTSEEASAIRWHMGAFGDDNPAGFCNAMKKYPLVWVVHCADMQAATYMESKYGNKKGF